MVQSSVGMRYAEFIDRLEAINLRGIEMNVPKIIACDHFTLSSTIDFVRKALEKQKPLD